MNMHAGLRDTLLQRELVEGGFQEQIDGEFRPDATAWSILALDTRGENSRTIDRSRKRLVKAQDKDGRINISADHPEASWPTALAAIAWHGIPDYHEVQQKAVQFMTATTGVHWPRQENSPLSHDTSIPGWPWVNGTHSWVEPTALALLALRLADHADHPRAKQGVKLLLDRQLSGGGWNYGNTKVFGQELRPMPASTGVALQALVGHAEGVKVETSLLYLESIIDRTRTPFSLAWGLLGLSAWGKRPRNVQELITASLECQDILGDYPTTHLSLLLLAATAENGLLDLMTAREGQNLD